MIIKANFNVKHILFIRS